MEREQSVAQMRYTGKARADGRARRRHFARSEPRSAKPSTAWIAETLLHRLVSTHDLGDLRTYGNASRRASPKPTWAVPFGGFALNKFLTRSTDRSKFSNTSKLVSSHSLCGRLLVPCISRANCFNKGAMVRLYLPKRIVRERLFF
jgi:hypothetical protein